MFVEVEEYEIIEIAIYCRLYNLSCTKSMTAYPYSLFPLVGE